VLPPVKYLESCAKAAALARAGPVGAKVALALIMKLAFSSWVRRGGFGATAAAVVLLTPVEKAQACSLPSCSEPVRLSGMQSVPGNLVYFEVTANDPGAMAMRTEAGEPIPASIRTIGNDRVFAPDAPIPPETNVVLEYELSCYDDIESPPPGEFAFRTFEHLPVTLQPGRLYVEEYGVASPGEANGERGFVRVKLQPSADYAAEHLMTHTLSIDGQPWSPWPLVGSSWQVSVDSQCRYQHTEIEYDSCGGVWSVPVGRHTLTLQTHILGQDTQPEPLTLEIETRCPTPGTETDVGDPDRDDTSGAAATETAAASRETRDVAACALPGGRGVSSGAGAGLLLLAALGLARRRGRRSMRS
jgi:hypothetical protein